MDDKNIESLMNKFKSISEQGWISGINSNMNSVGLTFEKLLNKNADSSIFPDYRDIEIKCTQRYSGFPISLFSLAFDGPALYEMNNLINKYGIFDEKYKNKKILMSFLKVGRKVLINNKYFFELCVDRNNEKLQINIYDINDKLIEEGPYITFKTLEERINLKLSNLAIVWASKKIVGEERYFRYYKICFYKLKSFNTFLTLLESNDIEIDLIGRVSRSGEEEGRQRNKNLVFLIPKENINLLFDELINYDKYLLKKRLRNKT